MTIYTQTTINGIPLPDSYYVNVIKSTSDNNASSNFESEIDNTVGVNKSTYTMGDEVLIYADKDVNPPTTKIFTGLLEDISFQGEPSREKIRFSGRDYTAYLMDRTVEPEVYTNLLAGSIVKDIVTKYAPAINIGSIQESTYLVNRMSFRHTPVFDAIKQLADLPGYVFYIDVDKYLHFEPKSTVSSNQTFNNTNITKADFEERRDTVFNQVWVYGNRYLDNYQQSFTAGSPLGGSSFTLLYKPHNTEVTVSGAIIQPGGIFGMTITPGSEVKYLVNFEDKQITFTSGTTQGANIPTSGNAVVIKYKRDLPIVKVGDNESSKAMYGTRVKVIEDTNITDPKTAEDRMKMEIADSAFPKMEGNLSVQGVINVTPSQTCVVNLPYHDVVNQTYDIIEANYQFDKSNNLSEQVLSVRVNKKLSDVTDTLKDLINSIKRLEGSAISESDVITRFQWSTGSIGIRQSGCKVYTKSIAGDTMIWGNQSFGIWGEQVWGDIQLQSFILGNATAAMLGTSKLGAIAFGLNLIYNDPTYGLYDVASYGDAGQYQQWKLVWSGCYF